jgi:hypothetical protein
MPLTGETFAGIRTPPLKLKLIPLPQKEILL